MTSLLTIVPEGAPPALGPRIFQKREWLAWPPPLLRTAPRISAGTAFKSRIKSSTDFRSRSGLPARALLTLATYAAWCLPW